MSDYSDWQDRFYEKMEKDFSLSAGSIMIFSRQSTRSSEVVLEIVPDPKLGTEQSKSQIDRIAVYYCPKESESSEDEWKEFASLPKEGGVCKHSPDWTQSNHYTYYARFVSFSGELGPVSIIQPHHEERVYGSISGHERLFNHIAGMAVGFCTIPILISLYLIVIAFWAFFNGGVTGFIPSFANTLPSYMNLTQMPEESFLIFVFGGLPLVFEYFRPIFIKDVNSLKNKSLYFIVTFLFSVAIIITQWGRVSEIKLMPYIFDNIGLKVIFLGAILVAIYRGFRGYETLPLEKESRTSQIVKRVHIIVGIISSLIFGLIASRVNPTWLRIVLIIVNLSVISLVNDLAKRRIWNKYFKSRF